MVTLSWQICYFSCILDDEQECSTYQQSSGGSVKTFPSALGCASGLREGFHWPTLCSAGRFIPNLLWRRWPSQLIQCYKCLVTQRMFAFCEQWNQGETSSVRTPWRFVTEWRNRNIYMPDIWYLSFLFSYFTFQSGIGVTKDNQCISEGHICGMSQSTFCYATPANISVSWLCLFSTSL